MKNFIVSCLFVLVTVLGYAQDWGRLPIPEADRELLWNLERVMRMPEGTHKIYNGEGNTSFDVLYTIRCKKNEWVIYQGGMESTFDALYTVTLSSSTFSSAGQRIYKIYKGGMKSSFDILYTMEYSDRGLKVYKGDTFHSNLIYSYQR